MSRISLKWFGGMIPRRGEQHLPVPHATEAENCNLYSGELRPLRQPSLTHQFCRPEEECFRSPLPPDPSIPPPEPPIEPPQCVPVQILSQSPALSLGDVFVDTEFTLSVTVNTDATEPVEYQWFKNGIAIPSAVDQTYTFTATEADSFAFWTVFVQNPCGEELSEPWHIGAVTVPPTCEDYECDALETFWDFNSTADLYYPVVGQYTRNGGIWTKVYRDAGGWNAVPQPDGSRNITVPTLPEDDDYNQTLPGTRTASFCGPDDINGAVFKDKMGNVVFDTATRAEFGTGDYFTVGAVYWQNTTAFQSLGSIFVSMNGANGQWRFGMGADGAGNPTVYARVGGANGKSFSLPTDRMCSLIYECSKQQVGPDLNFFGKIYVDGVLVSEASWTYTSYTFSYWWGFGLDRLTTWVHVGVSNGPIDALEFHQAYLQSFTNYYDPECCLPYDCEALETAILANGPIGYWPMYDRPNTTTQVVSRINTPDMDYADWVDNNDSQQYTYAANEFQACTNNAVRLTNGPNSTFAQNTGSPFYWPVEYRGVADENNIVGSTTVAVYKPTNTLQLTAVGLQEMAMNANSGTYFCELRTIIGNDGGGRFQNIGTWIHTFSDIDPPDQIKMYDGSEEGLLIFKYWGINYPAGTEGWPNNWIHFFASLRFVTNTGRDETVGDDYKWFYSSSRNLVNSLTNRIQSTGTWSHNAAWNRLITAEEEQALVDAYYRQYTAYQDDPGCVPQGS